MQKIIIVFFMAFLMGCKTAPGTLAWHNSTPNSEKMAYFLQVCTGYGYVRGTDDMRDCIAAEMRTAQSSAEQQRAAYASQIIFGKK